MYKHTNPITKLKQGKKERYSGFTLVEIMIVILIILMLTQLGDIWSLFRHKEKTQIEEFSVQLLGILDEIKTNALLGKTHKTSTGEYEIIRKHRATISFDDARDELILTSKINLAKSIESDYIDDVYWQEWQLQNLAWKWYECSPTYPDWWILGSGTAPINIDFYGDDLNFTSTDSSGTTTPINAHHIVLKLTLNQSHQEFHIDRRTWLTYTSVGNPISGKVFCN